MPRSGTGTYTLPESPFVSGTVIQSSPVNNDFSDIATALTQSLATTGVSSMTGPIKAASGSVSAPSITFANALGTGFYLSGADEFSWTAAGVLAAQYKADGTTAFAFDGVFDEDLSISGNLTVSGTATLAGNPVTNFPVGTAITGFTQTAAPTGWTKSVTHDNKALRLINGTVGSGGTVNFSTLFSLTAVDAFTLTSTEIPAHTHTYDKPNARVSNFTSSTSYSDFSFVSTASGSTGGGASHTHNIDMRVKYVDVILATKD